MALSVEQARERGICRICREPINEGSPEGKPKGFCDNYGEMTFAADVENFRPITYNFGREFAHTDCLNNGAKSAYKVLVRQVFEEVTYVEGACSHEEAIEKLKKSGQLRDFEWTELHVTSVKIKDSQVVRTADDTKVFKREG